MITNQGHRFVGNIEKLGIMGHRQLVVKLIALYGAKSVSYEAKKRNIISVQYEYFLHR